MRTTFFLTGLVAALAGSANSLKLAGETAADVITASTADVPAEIDAAAYLEASNEKNEEK